MVSRLTSVFKATVGLFVKKAATLLPKSYNKEILQIKSCVTWLFEKVLNQWKIWNWEAPNKTNSSEILWCYNSMSKLWGYEEMKNPDAKVNIGAVEAKTLYLLGRGVLTYTWRITKIKYIIQRYIFWAMMTWFTPMLTCTSWPRPGLKMGVENNILVRLRFGEPGGNHPPRIWF